MRKDRRSISEGVYAHNFIDYKFVAKNKYYNHFGFVSDIKPEENNQLYRHLKNKKIINAIFSRIFGGKTKKRITTQNMQRSHLIKTRCFTQGPPSRKRFTPNSCHSSERGDALQRISSFNRSLVDFHRSTSANKNRVSLLNKFNSKVKKFQSSLPQDPGEETRQSIEENEKLIELCIEESMQKHERQHFNRRYEQIIDYKQPVIEAQLKSKYQHKKYESKVRDEIRKNLHPKTKKR